ncbi:hypothetical protein H8D36_03170 [archaeon]|nr:hypothetical protein [archaeon]MBL7057168.1 hypothetical protein [Candidatus Woesearchaeota archaeon]
MSDLEIQKTDYKGLAVKYMQGDTGMPAVVYAKGLGIPGKEVSRMFILNQLGFSVAYAPYRGSWGSKGEFLSKNDGALSITDDVRDLIKFSLENLSSEVHLLGECLGASPALMASLDFDQATKIFTYGGMFYTDCPPKLKTYSADPRDKAVELGENLAAGGKPDEKFFPTYDGFNLDVWMDMINGNTDLMLHDHLDALATKQIMLMHPANDNLVSPERSEHLYNSLVFYCENQGIDHNATLRITNQGGHASGFGSNEQIETLAFLTGKELSVVGEQYQQIINTIAQNHVQNGVPFHDEIVTEMQDFQKAGILNQLPIEDIIKLALKGQ